MPVFDIITYNEPQSYAEILARQYELVRLRQANEIPDTLLLLEHHPTMTVGRRSRDHDFLTSQDILQSRGITIVSVDRGGEITYHAPGQLVGYPILDLRNHGQDLHRYLRDLEEALIRSLNHFGLSGTREAGRTGVWVNGKKVAAIGIKVARWVSMHGFALNVSSDLTPFRQDIIPCGIHDRDVTSLQELLPREQIRRRDIEPIVLQSFAEVFEMTPVLKASGYNGSHESAYQDGNLGSADR